MAFVYEVSFRPSDQVSTNQPYLAADMNDLLKNLNGVLTKISGPPCVTSEGPLYTKVPKGLKTSFGLKSKWAQIWDDTIISYDADAYGASARSKDDLEVIFGYFFTKPQPALILEKVFLHEFLHLVVDLPRVMHHGKINHIIQHDLKIPGDPNPLGTVGLEC